MKKLPAEITPTPEAKPKRRHVRTRPLEASTMAATPSHAEMPPTPEVTFAYVSPEELRLRMAALRQVARRRFRFSFPFQVGLAQTIVIAMAAIVISAMIWPAPTEAKPETVTTFQASTPTATPEATPTAIPQDRYGRPLMTQADFPCAEDELLGYAAPEVFEGARNIQPQAASADYVGCMHTDLLDHNAITHAVAECAKQGMIVAGFDYQRTGNVICASALALPQAGRIATTR